MITEITGTNVERCSVWTRLQRHPIAIEAHLEECLTLTYALAPHTLRRLLPPGLELDTFNGCGFVAVALVQTRSLRPAGLPKALGQDFFLGGYRIFTTFRPDNVGKTLRGLRILRSDADRPTMVAGGNLFTHYNYHLCSALVDSSPERIRVVVATPDRLGDVDVTATHEDPSLLAGSPFSSVREARRFAGPLPFTFDYESETHSLIAIKATRTLWRPVPVRVHVERMSFFDRAAFAGDTPILAAAFHVRDIDYRWERGVRYPLGNADRGGAS